MNKNDSVIKGKFAVIRPNLSLSLIFLTIPKILNILVSLSIYGSIIEICPSIFSDLSKLEVNLNFDFVYLFTKISGTLLESLIF